MRSVKKGDIVTFGRYDKNSIEVEMSIPKGVWTTPIEWVVVDDDNNMYTLISRYSLWRDGPGNPSVTFYESSMKKNLNEGFYEMAFSEEEKNALGYWTIEDGNSQYDCNVIIPTTEQITTWFPSSNERKSTEPDGKEFGYWLRDKSSVEVNGDIPGDSAWGHSYRGIRPVICVSKDYIRSTPDLEPLQKQYQMIEVGGVSFPVEWYYELSDSSTETHKNFKFESTSGSHTGVLTIFESEDPMTDEQFDNSVEQMVEIGYKASNAYIAKIDDTVKFETGSGLDAYRNTASIKLNGTPCGTVLYFINNEKLGKTIAVMLTLHSNDYVGDGLYEDLDNTVRNATVIESQN